MSFQPILAVNRQANRHWKEDKYHDRQAGRQGEGDWCGRKAVYSAWATVPLSWLGLVNQASPPGPIFHSQTFTTACSPACDEKGCCHRSYRSCGMSLSDRGISPIWAWSLKCPILSQCLSVGYMFCLMPAASHKVPFSKWDFSKFKVSDSQTWKKYFRLSGWQKLESFIDLIC